MEDQNRRAHKWLAQSELIIPESTTIEICPRSYPSLYDIAETDLSDRDLTEDKIYLT